MIILLGSILTRFKGLFDVVFIDEKWFYLTRKSKRYYLLPDEDEPLLRTCRSKNSIPKIMFLTVTARPRFNSEGVCTFDGKIGCFRLVKFERAKRRSVNRPAGTMEVKPIASITRDVLREFMIKKVCYRLFEISGHVRMSTNLSTLNKTTHRLI